MLANIFDTISGYLEEFTYLGVFVILFLCGLGLPIPEELTIVASGYISYLGLAKWPLATVVCIAAILAGDLVTYAIGRYYGMGVLRSRFFRKLLSEEHLQRVNRYFSRYGAKTVFFCRFFAGIRFCAYFVAGTARVPVVTFLVMDLLGALVSVPISVYAGFYFGENIEDGIKYLHRGKQVFLTVLVLVIAGLVLYYWRKSKKEKAAAAAVDEAAAKDRKQATSTTIPAPTIPAPTSQPAAEP